MTSNRKNPLPSDLYALTAEEYSLGRSNIEVVKTLLESGIKIIQYREKDKKQLYKYQECREIRQMTFEYDALFIVNDDLEIAKLVQADGVHIGQEDLPITLVRQIVGEDMIIGLSTHSPQQAQDAMRLGADYIGVGPIFATKTKKDVCSPVGWDYLQYVVQNITIPFVAIGGIKADNVAQVVKRGARCVALVTELVGATDIKGKVSEVQQIIKNGNISREKGV